MRFDEINILGDFKINGLTGGENQFMGLSGGELAWIDSAPEINGFNVYGTNYVICNSFTFSATASAENLINTYASASNFTPTSTNRAVVLINPGVYDFGSEPLGLSLSYVDLVGISSAASSVVFKGSPNIIKYYEGVDSGLRNVTIDNSSLSILGSASTYLRWDNVTVNGNCFSDGLVYSFVDLVGEFKNIKVKNSGFFANAENSIDGIFDKIDIEDGTEVFSASLLISGTYSNLKVNSGPTLFRSLDGSLIGTFENFDIDYVDNLFIGLTASGVFKQIKVQFVSGTIFNISLENSNVEDITVKECSSAFNEELINTDFKDITVNLCSGRVFGDSTGPVSGNFSNIYVGSCTHLFQGSEISSATFKNIKIDEVQSVVFNFTIVTSAEITDFEIGKFTSTTLEIFSSGAGLLNLNARNIKIQDQDDSILSGTIFATDGITGRYENIQIGSVSNVDIFLAATYVIGDFQDIDISKAARVFFSETSGASLDANCRNIKVGPCTSFFTNQDANISGTFSSISVGNCTTAFYSTSGGLYGSFDDLKFGTVNGPFFVSGSAMNVIVHNLYVDVINQMFLSNDLSGYFRNIQIESAKEPTFFKTSNSLIIDLKDFNIKNMTTLGDDRIFSSAASGGVVSGTYSEIYINHNTPTVNFFTAQFINGGYENLYLGTAATFFDGAINATVKNLNVASYIPTLFVGRISNSYINAIGRSQPAILINNDVIIDRCRFLADSGQFSVATLGPITSKISYLISNRNIDPQITNLISDPKNIISSAVRSEPKY